MKMNFLGAAREVTGSCFLVDCSMVQGGRTAVARNDEPFPFDPASIDFVLLTHAHIDHSGLLPKLTRAGFKGSIYATPATADLLGVMLPDSAHIQESDAKRDAKRFKEKAVPPLDELFEVLTLIQTGKMQRIPVVLVGRAFWRRVVDFDLLLDEGYVSPPDLDLFTCVDEAEEIVSVLDRFYVNKAASDGAT